MRSGEPITPPALHEAPSSNQPKPGESRDIPGAGDTFPRPFDPPGAAKGPQIQISVGPGRSVEAGRCPRSSRPPPATQQPPPAAPMPPSGARRLVPTHGARVTARSRLSGRGGHPTARSGLTRVVCTPEPRQPETGNIGGQWCGKWHHGRSAVPGSWCRPTGPVAPPGAASLAVGATTPLDLGTIGRCVLRS